MRTKFVPNSSYLRVLAHDLNIDANRLIADMEGAVVGGRITNALALARVFGIPGTPALVVGRTLVIGQIAATRLKALQTEGIDNRTRGQVRHPPLRLNQQIRTPLTYIILPEILRGARGAAPLAPWRRGTRRKTTMASVAAVLKPGSFGSSGSDGARFVDGFAVFGLGIAVVNDAPAGLDI